MFSCKVGGRDMHELVLKYTGTLHNIGVGCILVQKSQQSWICLYGFILV
jgi:hypothetical protein